MGQLYGDIKNIVVLMQSTIVCVDSALMSTDLPPNNAAVQGDMGVRVPWQHQNVEIA